MTLEIDSAGWVAIIGALATASTVIGAAVVGIIMAYKGINQKLDTAAARREEIKDEIKQ